MKIEIKNRWTGEVIFACEKNSLKLAVEFAVKSGASLNGASLDYSCWPLWCGTKNVKVDVKIAAQLAAHFCVLDCKDEKYQAARKAVLEFAKTSHRAEVLGL